MVGLYHKVYINTWLGILHSNTMFPLVEPQKINETKQGEGTKQMKILNCFTNKIFIRINKCGHISCSPFDSLGSIDLCRSEVSECTIFAKWLIRQKLPCFETTSGQVAWHHLLHSNAEEVLCRPQGFAQYHLESTNFLGQIRMRRNIKNLDRILRNQSYS
jgi:hypothetical protein